MASALPTEPSPPAAADWRPSKAAGASSPAPLRLAAAVALALAAAGAGAALGVLRPWQPPPAPPAGYTPSADAAAVRAHVAAQMANVQRPAGGQLAFPYLIPFGGYDALWDWDSVFLGVATLRFGSAPYFAGSMLNFLANVSLPDGQVRGCLTPDGSSPYLRHAKPILVWGAFLAARATGDFAAFRPYAAQMEALLLFWAQPPRYDAASGCSLWYEMVESGADNLAYVPCASDAMACWAAAPQLYAAATPDLPVFRERQALAYSLFQQRWASEDAAAAKAAAAAAAVAAAIAAAGSSSVAAAAASNAAAAAAAATAATAAASALRAAAAVANAAAVRAEASRCLDGLWLESGGASGSYWTAKNVTSGALMPTRTYQLAWPLWGTNARGDFPARAAAAADAIAAPDMVASDSGLVRSLSSADPLYTNEISIPGVIGANWRGPAWIHTNVILAYSLAAMGRGDAAKALAKAVLRVLADDLARTSTWHENYNTDNVTRTMGAPGFISFNALSADLEQNLAEGVDPFALA
jgi:hypothetical protein